MRIALVINRATFHVLQRPGSSDTPPSIAVPSSDKSTNRASWPHDYVHWIRRPGMPARRPARTAADGAAL